MSSKRVRQILHNRRLAFEEEVERNRRESETKVVKKTKKTSKKPSDKKEDK